MVSLNACGGGTPGDTAATSATASTAVTTSLSVTPTTLALVVGKSAAAQATVLPASSTIAWSSGDTSIATVSSAGAVSCVA
ncbi:MAG: Ig-like domain-containing protein, partial [Paraburkholderia tropica]